MMSVQQANQTVVEFMDVAKFFGFKSREAKRFRARHADPAMQQLFDNAIKRQIEIDNSVPTP